MAFPLKFVVGLLGNIISVLVFASPIKTFWRMVKNRSTEDFRSDPYVVTLFSSALWVYYGATKPDGLLIVTVNSVGILLEFIYVSIFLMYSPPALRVKTGRMVGLLSFGFIGVVVVMPQLVMGERLSPNVVGALCACLNTFMYATHLDAMVKQITVIDSRSVEYMPFFLTFFLCLNGGVWTLYAVLDSDVFIIIPNGIGFFLGTIQLIVSKMHMNSNGHQLLNDTIEEAHEPDEEQVEPDEGQIEEAHEPDEDIEEAHEPDEEQIEPAAEQIEEAHEPDEEQIEEAHEPDEEQRIT